MNQETPKKNKKTTIASFGIVTPSKAIMSKAEQTSKPTLTAEEQINVNNYLKNENDNLKAGLAEMRAQLAKLSSYPTQRRDESNIAERIEKSREFKITSAQPPSFDGSVKQKPGAQSSILIETYLYSAEKKARMYGFRFDNEPSQFINHPTYVDWVSGGFTDAAERAWIHEANKPTTWKEFKEWVMENFSSIITAERIVEEFRKLKQTGPCTKYTVSFNEFVSTMQHLQVSLIENDALLVLDYRLGLKLHIRGDPDVRAAKTLKEVQSAALQADESSFNLYKSIANLSGVVCVHT